MENVSTKKIPDHQRNVILEVICNDVNDEEVEVPYVMLKLGK